MKTLCTLLPVLFMMTARLFAEEENLKIILSAHNPLTQEQLKQAVEALGNRDTNGDIRGYLFDRLSTENFEELQGPLETVLNEQGVSEEELEALKEKGTAREAAKRPGLKALCIYHQPLAETSRIEIHAGGVDPFGFGRNSIQGGAGASSGNHTPSKEEITYMSQMLDFMELPIPYDRKINGLRNIQRIMNRFGESRSLKDPQLKSIRKRLYALALDESTPDNLSRALAKWLRDMR